jgi:hypothetical protein
LTKYVCDSRTRCQLFGFIVPFTKNREAIHGVILDNASSRSSSVGWE